ncbi:MAG: EAL domain-containing protein [Pseudolabrys sp.]|nr:EAL domain-containing protein [Pseudolabrys sp.]
MLRGVGEAAYEWQLSSDAIAWSEGAATLLGADMAQIATGKSFAQHVGADGGSRFDAVNKSGKRDEGEGVPYQVQYSFRSASGAILWIEDTGRWFKGPSGEPARAAGVIRNITERHEHEQSLIKRAQFDPLTGEFNRLRLVELLESTLKDAERFRTSCGFLLVAINNLGRLNQAYGYTVVDDLIAQVGKRIRSKLRGKDHLGLFSGNKFGIVLTSCTPEELDVAAERLLSSVREEVVSTVAGPVAVTISIGGVTAPRHARTVDDILSRAQDALDHARSKRQGSFYAYRPNIELDASRRENVRATDEIVKALNERRIAVAYEPVVDAKTRAVKFYECLMRVQRADGTLAHANEIIPVAERVGLVRMLDHRVLELVVAELVENPTLECSINVSPSSTLDPGWWDGLGAMLKAHPGAAGRLIVEITETTAIQNIDDARGFVARVKDLGCHIAIDDFGAGYTSFRNLRKLGVDLVKIDGAFVQNMCKSEDDRAFVRALIDLSRRLGLRIVAEWVQDEETAKVLTEWGCDYLQGALVGLASTDCPWRAAPAVAKSA